MCGTLRLSGCAMHSHRADRGSATYQRFFHTWPQPDDWDAGRTLIEVTSSRMHGWCTLGESRQSPLISVVYSWSAVCVATLPSLARPPCASHQCTPGRSRGAYRLTRAASCLRVQAPEFDEQPVAATARAEDPGGRKQSSLARFTKACRPTAVFSGCQALLVADDDVTIRCPAVEEAFASWRRHPDSIVGYRGGSRYGSSRIQNGGTSRLSSPACDLFAPLPSLRYEGRISSPLRTAACSMCGRPRRIRPSSFGIGRTLLHCQR